LKARHIDGYSEDRREILASFARREFELLNNAMLLTEGFDDPSIDCIVNLRPTRSRPLYAQIVGRGTRICENKDGLLILDFLFQHEKHALVRPANLIAASEEEAEEMMQAAYEQAESGRVSDELDLQDLASECRSKREQKLRDELAHKANRASKFISAEEFALKHHHMEIAEYQPTMKWHEEQVTERQVKYIEEAGIDPATVNGKGQATAILGVYFEQKGKLPASSKQKWVLRTAGWRSKDGLRGPDQATVGDARDYFTARNKTREQQPEEAF
jgi:superfamily II DNA or RNA helicase